MSMPESLVPHEPDFKPNAWEGFTYCELGWWVHLLTARAVHRSNKEKMRKDLYDAQNYLTMMQAKLDALKTQLD